MTGKNKSYLAIGTLKNLGTLFEIRFSISLCSYLKKEILSFEYGPIMNSLDFEIFLPSHFTGEVNVFLKVHEDFGSLLHL